MIEVDLLNYLLGVDELTAIVGDAIYPQHVPQKTGSYPCVTITTIDAVYPTHLGGSSGSVNERIQIDSYGNNNKQAIQISEAIRHALQGIGQVMMGDTFVGEVELDTKQHVFNYQTNKATDQGNWRVISDFIFCYDLD